MFDFLGDHHSKSEEKDVVHNNESIFLNNTSSTSYAGSQNDNEEDEETNDPFGFIDESPRKANMLKMNKRATSIDDDEEPDTKRIKVMGTNCSKKVLTISEIKEEVVTPCSLTKTATIPNETCDTTVAKEATFISDFRCSGDDEDKRKIHVLGSDIQTFEIYHTMRRRSTVVSIPRIFVSKGEIETIPQSTYNFFGKEQIQKNCSVSDRRKAILRLISRRYGLRLTADTIHLGAAILDRCLNLLMVVPGTLFELSAVSMILASKVEEVNYVIIKDLITCGIVNDKSVKELGKLEQLILRTLSFDVTFPTPLTFANCLLIEIRAEPSKINMTHYLLELSILNISTRHYPADWVAHASVCLAFALDSDTSIESLIETEVKLKSFSLIPPGKTRSIMRLLTKEFKLAISEMNEVFSEYERAGRDSVALRQVSEELARVLG